jgi:hypothetical protein
MGRKLILSVSVLAFLTAQAGATVLQLDGVASVDRGSGYNPATNNMQLKPGDRIRVTAGCANVVYDNGYLSKVCRGQMMLVSDIPPAPRPVTGSLKDTPACCEPDYWSLPIALTVIGVGVGVGASCCENSQSVSP